MLDTAITTDRHASAIRCESLTIQFPRGPRAVDGVDLSAQAGQVTALIGPSGCGKTTLLRLIAGLEQPTSGQVHIEPPVASNQGGIAFVFQRPNLLPWRTALENVELPLELMRHATAKQRRSIARQMLSQVELSDAIERFPDQLSGGMQMRVSLARALVTQPRVLLLDEPFASLDDMLRTQLGQLLLHLWDQTQFTAVMVTHNIAESILLSHRIIVMRGGRVHRILDNPLPWPRNDQLHSTAEFAAFYGVVSRAMREES